MGSDSIELGLKNVWHSWVAFRKGKRATAELHEFQYHLERNLFNLQRDLESGTYHHGGYKTFTVSDNKRREISVASIRDRVVHRLVYDYLTPLYDKAFIHDAWSCRVGKDLLGAIQRAQHFLKKSPHAWVWRGDIEKFFDSVDHETLLKILARKIKESKTYALLKGIIGSFAVLDKMGGGGIPIGNLTSQIFANIYLNEFDRFVKHELKVKDYLRYGDDFIMLESNKEKLEELRSRSIDFLNRALKLTMNRKNDRIIKPEFFQRGELLWNHEAPLQTQRNEGISVAD